MSQNRNSRKPKPPVVIEESLPKSIIEEPQSEKACVNCVPEADVEKLVAKAVAKVENDANTDIAKLKKELADANSLLGRQRGDLETLRKKSEADKTVIAGLKTQLDKLNSFGRWLYGINY